MINWVTNYFMKKRIAFALIMGLITTTLISFVLIAVNVGFTNNFLVIWMRSWILSYSIVICAMVFIAPKVQAFVDTLLNRSLIDPKSHNIPFGSEYLKNDTQNNNNKKELFMSQETTNQVGASSNTETAIFSSGCFWGTEFYFQKAEGVISTAVGYTGGSIENPTYKEVTTGRTGHAEAIQVTYDPTKTSYENMVKLFYETHDQSQKDRQGPDIGTQYRSGIFYENEEQKEIAKTEFEKSQNQARLEKLQYDLERAELLKRLNDTIARLQNEAQRIEELKDLLEKQSAQFEERLNPILKKGEAVIQGITFDEAAKQNRKISRLYH